MGLDHFLEQLVEIEGQQELVDFFEAEIKSFGYRSFDAFAMDASTLHAPLQPGNWAVTSYDFEILKNFVLKGFAAICPAVAEAGKTLVPFDYVEFLNRQPRNVSVILQRQLIKFYSIQHAWLIPLSTVGRLKAITVYLDSTGPKATDLFHKTRHDVHLRSLHFFEVLEAIRPPLPDDIEITEKAVSPLSQREKQCLQWASAGKTNWEIAQILNVSENTIRFHLKNCFRKLGVSTRAQAISEAGRRRLLD